ncbi:MAG: hypothetical protein GY942_17280 [Aestuariibacter sp.]|nr:hypothetical protein [Aestuariibacter sp.]
MTDKFASNSSRLDSPAKSAFEITPSDSTDLTLSARALYVGAVGDVKVTTVGGDTVTFVDVSGLLPVRVQRVFSTGTDATGIVGLL